MTLKTSKQKENNSLILDDEFLQYCKLNNIEDIEKLAREVFNQGFTILKYGRIPSGETIKNVATEVLPVTAMKPPDGTGIKSAMDIINTERKEDKNSVYSE
jgi:hypothetical protein